MAEAEVIMDGDAENSLTEITPYNTIEKIKSIRKAVAENEPADKDIYILEVSNLPKNCTPKMIVEFFASYQVTKTVPVYLGEDGVIIQRLGVSTYGYVLFQSFDRMNLGILKKGQVLGDKIISCKVITLFEAMIIGCNLWRKLDSVKDFERYIVLRNVPRSVPNLESGISNFLDPFYEWIDAKVAPIMISESESTYDIAYCTVSELAAFVIHMKRNGSQLIVNGIPKYIQVLMASCTTTFSLPGNPMLNYLPGHQMGNFVRREKYETTFSALVILRNLPTVSVADITSIFKGRVQILRKNICLVKEHSNTSKASVLFTSMQEAFYAVNGMKSIEFRNQEVELDLICIEDM